MAIKNPFVPAEKIAKKLKVLLYGASGSGKTRAALTFPRAAVIDTENGTDLYSGRAGVQKFSVLRAKTLSEVEGAVAFIREDAGKSFDTLIIDAITVLYDVQKEAASKNGKDGEMNPRLWNRVNGRMVALYNALSDLPVHVVMIARESEMYEGEGLNLKRTGTKPDADKKILYMFDFVVRMKPDHSGEIIKSRGINMSNAMPTVNWQAFEKAAGLFADGAQAAVINDDQAAEIDARAYSEAPGSKPAQPSKAAPAKSDEQSKPAPAGDKPAPHWYQDTEAMDTLVAKARSAGYIEAKQGLKDLLKLIDKPEWASFATRGDAATAIKAAAESLKAQAAAAKPTPKPSYDPTEYTCVVEDAKYDGERIFIETEDHGRISIWSRETLATVTGDEFAETWHIRSWQGTKSEPVTYSFDPLQIFYVIDGKYPKLVHAKPVAVDKNDFDEYMDAPEPVLVAAGKEEEIPF